MVAVIIYALAKHMPVKEIFNQVWDGAIVFGNFFLIIVAGTMFSRVIALSGLADAISGWISSMHIAPFAVFLVVLVFYLVCGCLMEMMSMLIITLPIIFPLLVGLGYDPLILVVCLVFIMDMAQMSPPVGMGVFMVAATAKVSTTEIFKGIIPFFIVDIVAVLLMALFPQIVLWLPNLMA